MHPAISDFPSVHFYDGQVSTGIRASDRPPPRGFPWPAASGPVAFVRVNESGGEAGGVGVRRGQLESRGGTEAAVQGGSFASAALGTSYCNRREAEAVAFALDLLLREGDVEVRAALLVADRVRCHAVQQSRCEEGRLEHLCGWQCTGKAVRGL